MKTKQTLCGMCAVVLREQGMELTQTGVRTEKISCAHCGKRRYGTEYEIEKRSGKEKKK